MKVGKELIVRDPIYHNFDIMPCLECKSRGILKLSSGGYHFPSHLDKSDKIRVWLQNQWTRAYDSWIYRISWAYKDLKNLIKEYQMYIGGYDILENKPEKMKFKVLYLGDKWTKEFDDYSKAKYVAELLSGTYYYLQRGEWVKGLSYPLNDGKKVEVDGITKTIPPTSGGKTFKEWEESDCKNCGGLGEIYTYLEYKHGSEWIKCRVCNGKGAVLSNGLVYYKINGSK